MHRRGWPDLDFSRRRITRAGRSSPRSNPRRRQSSGSSYRGGVAGLVAAPVVRALQALRGMALVAAATVIAELGDITRFANPRQLMAFLGLFPWSTPGAADAARRHHASGNGAARRMLIEAAWSYRFPARISRDTAAPGGLAKPTATRRGRRKSGCVGAMQLARAGKSPTVVTTAIARELAGFAWRSPNTLRPPPLDAELDRGLHKRRSSPTSQLSKARGWRHGHGQENLASTISRIFSDAGA